MVHWRLYFYCSIPNWGGETPCVSLAHLAATVNVIRGEKDIIVPKGLIAPDVKIHEFKGQGHDPFEEQVQMFVETVGRILDDENI